MKTLRLVMLLLTIGLIGSATTPDSVSAQGPECADCLSDWLCSSSPWSGYYSCEIVSGQPCAGWGLCIIVNEDDSPEAWKFAAAGIEASDWEPVRTLEWGEVDVAQVAEGQYALWSCQGSVLALFERDHAGGLVRQEFDRADYRGGYDLDNLMVSAVFKNMNAAMERQ